MKNVFSDVSWAYLLFNRVSEFERVNRDGGGEKSSDVRWQLLALYELQPTKRYV